jgi:zinc protease
MKDIKPYLLIALLICSVTYQGQSQLTKVASVEGITEYNLPNGLRVLLFPDPSKPQVTVNVTYLVGSRHEDYGETGMAHLLEHLVFKGTPDHPDISKQLKDHGAFYNGTTWLDRTNYFETLTATDENLEWALKMEADRMVNSFISGEDLKSEMTVVRNEFEMGENRPTGVLMKRVMAAAYQWHNYGQSTIGARADLENVPIERLQAFYKEYYQPDNSVLLVAGKFEEEKTKQWIEQYFGAIPRPERKIYTTYTREPTQDGEREVTLKRVGDVQALAALYHICPGAHPDYPSVEILNQILTDEPSGRLYKALVETKLASNVWGFSAGLKEPGFLYIGADVLKEKDIEITQAALQAALDDLKNNPPTVEEVERAKTKILKQWDLAFNDTRQVGIFMSDYISSGDWRLAFIERDRTKSASIEDVLRVSEKYFKPSNRTIGRFIPEENPDRVEIPDVIDIEKLVSEYKGTEEVSQGEAFDPTPENIEGRVQRVQRTNQIDYAFMPKETRGDAVQLRMTFEFGSKQSLRNLSTPASLTAAMLNKGTNQHTRQEIKDAFDQLKANVNFFGGNNSVNVTVNTERDKLPEVIKLIAEVMKEPSFPEEEFTKLIDERLAQIEEQKSDPMALAQSELQRINNPYPKDDIRYNSSFVEDIEMLKAAKLDDVKSFYNMFYGADHARVSVVGDFDPAEIQKELDMAFGDWKSKSVYDKLIAELHSVKAENKNIETPDKANAAFFAGFNFAMQDNDPDYPALVLANNIFGGGGLSSRLADRIRQKEGLSYGVGAFMNANPYTAKTTWGAYAIYAPENVEPLEKAFNEELTKAITEGFTEAEVEDAKKGWLQQQQVSRSQDGFLTGTLNSYLDLDRTMMWNKELEEKIAKLTTAQVNTAFKKYIDPAKITYIKAGDFAKKVVKP